MQRQKCSLGWVCLDTCLHRITTWILVVFSSCAWALLEARLVEGCGALGTGTPEGTTDCALVLGWEEAGREVVEGLRVTDGALRDMVVEFNRRVVL